jgi:hypothetical protein
MSTKSGPPGAPVWVLIGPPFLVFVGGLLALDFVPEWRANHFYVEGRCVLLDSYCPTIDHFALVLRCSSSADEFGPEAIERIRRRRPARYITADIVVPLAASLDKTEKQIKEYLAARVRLALEMCVARLKKDRDVVVDMALLEHVDAAIAEFLRTPTPHKVWE